MTGTATHDRAIAIRGVSKTFVRGSNETRALSSIDLEVAPGEFVAIVGPSGCGKSTLMRLVAGLLDVSEGEIRFGDTPVNGPRGDTGIVFQKANLAPWRTIIDNVLLQIELRGLSARSYRMRAEQLLAAVGLQDFAGSLPYELSGGMQQRACIARALIHEPAVLMMDEPFGALDALTREQMRLDLEAIWMANRMSVLFITHSIDEAVLLADRVIVMSPRPGQIDTILDIGLPRPRGLGARHEPAFIDAVEEITQRFMSRGILSAARVGTAIASGQITPGQGDRR